MLNAFSVDVEDWFNVANMSGVINRRDWARCELCVVDNTRRLLDLLERYEANATFFVLGWIADRVPDLVLEIAQRGHEIGSHGYSHRRLVDMTPAEFEQDLRRSIAVLRHCAGQRILGFRAPSFSVTRETLWAMEVLSDHGIECDSSVYPLHGHPDYGIGTASRDIHSCGGSLVEFPLAWAEIFGRRVPFSGGGYFRLYPYRVSRSLLRHCNRAGRTFVFYIHPWEIDDKQPRVAGLPRSKKFRHYCNLDKTYSRLERLLEDFQLAPIRHLLGLNHVAN